MINLKIKNLIEGKIFKSNNCGNFKVLEYNGTFNVIIEFLQTGYIYTTSYSNIKKGSVHDPYYPSVYNIGYFGIGKYKSRPDGGKQTVCYKRWKEIINRCYNPKCSGYNRYGGRGIKISNEWKNFQNFAEWWEENCINENFCLDKDILIKNNKIYSSETCCFVPPEINVLFTLRSYYRGEFPIGVKKSKNDTKYIAQIMKFGKKYGLGRFDTPEEAFLAYKKAKESYIKEIADLYKSQISDKVYMALYNYEVEIDD